MGRKSHILKVSVPIPAHIPPDAVISALHTHLPVLKTQAFVKSWNEILHSELDASVKQDIDFFRAARHDAVAAPGEPEVKCYSIIEAIPLIPKVGKWAEKEISFPSRFQNVTHGLRAQANAPGGVIVKSEWTVEKAEVNAVIDGWKREDGTMGPMWQLTEECEVEASNLLMPFIAGDMEKAHREICQKIITMMEEVMKGQDGRSCSQ
jgi:hypothetical protein